MGYGADFRREHLNRRHQIPPMKRFPDWVFRLEVFLRAQQRRRFRYGEFDCCLFVCGAIQAMTGTDIAAGFRGRYETRAAGRRLLAAAGGVEALARGAGMREVAPAMASRGDVAHVRWGALGLVALNGRKVLGPAEIGLVEMEIPAGGRIWRIG